MIRLLHLPLLALMLLSCLVAERTHHVRTIKGSKVKIMVINPVDSSPTHGGLNYQIRIENKYPDDLTWTFRFKIPSYTRNTREGTHTLTRTYSVEANRTSTFDVTVPFPPNNSYDIELVVSGPGVMGDRISLSGTYSSSYTTPYFLMSQTLAVNSWGPLKDEIDKRGSTSLNGSAIKPERLPTHWYAYSGVKIIMLTQQDWNGLRAEQRQSLYDGVMQGSSLWIYREDDEPEETLLLLEDRPTVLGFGEIRWRTYQGEKIDPTLASISISKIPAYEHDKVETWYRKKTTFGLLDMVRAVKINTFFILGFVITFAIIIGPINLFWFAGSANRYRLFWTTPLISVTASVLLILLIFFQDGIGGEGKRTGLWLLDSASKRLYIIQEQACRTGVLFTTGFTIEEDAVVSNLPITLQPSIAQPSYRQNGRNFSGNWFSSRTTHGHQLRSLRNTRAKVTVEADQETLVLRSSIPGMLETIYYIDPKGTVFIAQKVSPGNPAQLTASSNPALNTWLDEQMRPLGEPLRQKISGTRSQKGVFYASLKPGKNTFIDTLSTIRWDDQPALVLGRVITGEQP